MDLWSKRTIFWMEKWVNCFRKPENVVSTHDTSFSTFGRKKKEGESWLDHLISHYCLSIGKVADFSVLLHSLLDLTWSGFPTQLSKLLMREPGYFWPNRSRWMPAISGWSRNKYLWILGSGYFEGETFSCAFNTGTPPSLARHQLLAARQEQEQEKNWLKERMQVMDVPGRSCFAAPWLWSTVAPILVAAADLNLLKFTGSICCWEAIARIGEISACNVFAQDICSVQQSSHLPAGLSHTGRTDQPSLLSLVQSR